MAVNNDIQKTMENLKKGLNWGFPLMRAETFPIEMTSLFSSVEDAKKYASGQIGTEKDKNGLKLLAYIGLIITTLADTEANYTAGNYLIKVWKLVPATKPTERLADLEEVDTPTVEIVDNLTSTDTDKALSANQGKILNDKITALDGKLTGVYTYKGSVATVENLPIENVQVGDVYNVEADGGNYAWDGTKWDALGTTVDLSSYYTKTETDDLLTGYVQKKEGYDLISNENLLQITTNKNDISTLKTNVASNTEALEVLNGDVNIVNSIDYKINLALKWNEIMQ